MKLKSSLVLAVLLLITGSAMAATFVVPKDEELLLKSMAVAIGTVEGSYVQEANGTIETIHEIRLERGFKGAVKKDELLRVVTLGGVIGQRGVLVPGEAQFRQGERVLVFLNRDEKGRWRTTDLTLGRFEFVTSTKGERMLVREMEDVVGWDHSGKVHKEKVRRESGFLQFIEARANNRAAKTDYVVDASEVTLAAEPLERLQAAANATSFPASTYSDFVNNQPIRWPNMAAGVRFYKRSDQNISGAADGGVSVIQGGLAAWTNEPSSNVNLSYVGQLARASANHDATNVVEFNDPQSRISGSWTGSGTVGICFLSFSGSHSFLGQSWLNITDADVVFQNGYPATNASFSSAMTHELGHGIGWRHSNQNHVTGGACNSAVEECTSAAIMNSSVSANYGYALQPWDRNAAQSVYPGAACTAPAITAQPTSRSITSGQSTTLSVTATGTSVAYQWYVGASGNTASPISGATGSSVTVAPTSTTSYWVRVSNACGAVNSVAATVTVTPAPPACTAPAITTQPTSRTIPSGQSTTLTVAASGTAPLAYQWYTGASGNTASPVSGATSTSLTVAPTATTSYWARVSNSCGAANSSTATVTVTAPPAPGAARMVRDFTGDGKSDILWRNFKNGQNGIWPMNGVTRVTPDIGFPTLAPEWTMSASADFNKDGSADIVWRNTSTGVVMIWFMNRSTVVSTATVTTVLDQNWIVAASGDFDVDGYADILWRNVVSGLNEIWLMNGAVARVKTGITSMGASWRLVGSGQFNNSGSTDLVWRNTAAPSELEIWMMNNTAILSRPVVAYVTDQRWQIVAIADYNQDGHDDIVWRNQNTLQNGLWTMNGITRTGDLALPPGTSGDWQMFGPK